VSLQEFVIQLLAGLSRAGLLFTVSAGLTLVFGALRVINLAHGSLYMVGAFVTSSVVTVTGSDLGLVAALVASAAVAGVIGLAVETGVLRRLYREEHLLQLLATYGIVLIVADLVRMIWGSSVRSVSQPAGLRGSVDVLGSPFPAYGLFVIAFGLAVGAALWLLINRTGLGRDIRAAIADPEMLGGVGVNRPRLFTSVFVVGSALAGLAGAVVAPSTSVSPGMDIEIIVQAFAVTIIGGLGSIPGALAGAVIVGLTYSFGIFFAPRLSLAFIFAAMVVVLSVRPSGLFGVPERA